MFSAVILAIAFFLEIANPYEHNELRRKSAAAIGFLDLGFSPSVQLTVATTSDRCLVLCFAENGMCILDRNTSDRNAMFVELLTLHQRTVYGFIYTLVPNAADAEDLLQQTSLILWQKFEEFDANRSFSAWACGIAHFTVLDHLKKMRRSRVVFDDELMALLAETRQNREQVHLADRTRLTECIEELSEADRKLIKLCYTANRTIKAAAAAMDRPVNAVYMSLVRVRRLLGNCIRRTSTEEGG